QLREVVVWRYPDLGIGLRRCDWAVAPWISSRRALLGCSWGHAAAGIAVAAAAAIRRRNVSAQDRFSANACIRQTDRTFSRPCTRNRVIPRVLMMPCARSVSLRRR